MQAGWEVLYEHIDTVFPDWKEIKIPRTFYTHFVLTERY